MVGNYVPPGPPDWWVTRWFCAAVEWLFGKLRAQVTHAEVDKSQKLLDVAENALIAIGKHQHDGRRGCTCEIIGRAKDEMAAIRRGNSGATP